MNIFHRATRDCIGPFIRRENVIRFYKLLAIETNPARCKLLKELLAEQQEMQAAAGDLTTAIV
jgi:hypothetical protein